MKSSSVNTARVVAAIGTTGSGKSLWLKQGLAAKMPARLLVWDPQGEYSAFGRTYVDRAALLADVRAAKSFAAIYQPGDRISLYAKRFAWFCRLAYALGRLSFVVEELADVTTPSRAPDAWSVITRKGRHKALSVYATTQRPASVDKDFFGQCTLVHCGRLTYAGDLATMSGVLGVSRDQIAGLGDLAYIERDIRTGERREGVLIARAPIVPART